MQKYFLDLPGLQHYHSLILGLFELKHDFTKTYEEAISGKENIVYFTVDTQDVVLNGKSYGKLPEDYLTNLGETGDVKAVDAKLTAHMDDITVHISTNDRTTLNTVNNTFEITSDATTIKSTNGLSLTADTIQLIPSDTGNIFLNGDVKILTTIEREVGALMSTTPVIKAGGAVDGLILSIQTTADSTIYTKVPNLVVDGDLQTPTMSETSDIRKKDIKEDLSLDKCYELIDKCQTIIYSLKDQTKDLIGMIAQEVEQYFPELVNEDINGFKTLAYSRLVVLCFKVLKDVINRLEKLEINNI